MRFEHRGAPWSKSRLQTAVVMVMDIGAFIAAIMFHKAYTAQQPPASSRHLPVLSFYQAAVRELQRL